MWFDRVTKVIYEGLSNYEKTPNASPSSLFGTLMMLKAACINNACFIDRLISKFMHILQRMAREHLNPVPTENTAVASELLILSLDLVKNRVAGLVTHLILHTLCSVLDKTHLGADHHF